MRNKHPRRYALFQKHKKRWIRISEIAYTKKLAIEVFKDRIVRSLISDEPEKRLRPVN